MRPYLVSKPLRFVRPWRDTLFHVFFPLPYLPHSSRGRNARNQFLHARPDVRFRGPRARPSSRTSGVAAAVKPRRRHSVFSFAVRHPSSFFIPLRGIIGVLAVKGHEKILIGATVDRRRRCRRQSRAGRRQTSDLKRIGGEGDTLLKSFPFNFFPFSPRAPFFRGLVWFVLLGRRGAEREECGGCCRKWRAPAGSSCPFNSACKLL
jgi:hypothetical protein